MIWGLALISFVFRSRMMVKLGWSLALGWMPVSIFRLLLFRSGLFSIEGILFPAYRVQDFPVCLAYDRCYRPMTGGGESSQTLFRKFIIAFSETNTVWDSFVPFLGNHMRTGTRQLFHIKFRK